MNIIQHLQQDKNYISIAIKALQLDIETIDIDCSQGETDRTLILFIVKNNYSFDEAFAMLTLKQKMLNEEWEDLELYDADDVKLWSQMLVKEYGNNMYDTNVSEDEFLKDHIMYKLKFADGIQSIFYNDKQIDFETLQNIFPCKSGFVQIAKTSFERLEAEYYIETDKHYVLCNWYTTA
jgi:hypothetical protein